MNPLELQSDRLTLRLLELADLQFVHHLYSMPEVDRFNTLGIPKNIAETKAVITPLIV